MRDTERLSRPCVVITQPVHQEVWQRLTKETDVVMNPGPEPWPLEVLLAHAHKADALLVFMPDRVDADFLRQCPRLKIVAAALKGFDNFDVGECTKRGIRFTIVPDLLSKPTAELALALLLGLARNVPAGDAHIRSGNFQGWRPVLYGRSLFGSTVGLIGYGAVARAFANLISPFGCRIIWTDNSMASATLAEVLAESDFLLPLVPLTPDTLYLLNQERLSRLKRGAFLINVGRGSVVDEDAIANALESGHLAGYAADVFEMEDWARADRPRQIPTRLLDMRGRTLFTPHLGSATAAARLEIEQSAATSILEALGLQSGS